MEGCFVSALGSRPSVEELGSGWSWNRNISGHEGGEGGGSLWRALEGQLAAAGQERARVLGVQSFAHLATLGRSFITSRMAHHVRPRLETCQPSGRLCKPPRQPCQHQGLTGATVVHRGRSSPVTPAPTLPRMPTAMATALILSLGSHSPSQSGNCNVCHHSFLLPLHHLTKPSGPFLPSVSPNLLVLLLANDSPLTLPSA